MKASITVQRALSAALWLGLIGLVAWASTQKVWTADWTANNRNSLTPASEKLLESLPGAIRFTAYVYPSAEIRREIRARLAPYQRLREDISLNFIDPAKDPVAVREAGIGENGEVIVEYQGRTENLRALSEQTITAALQRLAYVGEATIRFLAGHGERDPTDGGQSGYKLFVDELTAKGLRTERFNFSQAGNIPQDTHVLVVAAPQRALLDAEQDRLVDFVQAGGNMLWLIDPDSPPLPKLAAALGVAPQAGTIVYQDYDLLGTGHPALALVADYAGHPITREMVDLTLYPLAGGLTLAENSNWFGNRLLASPERSWLEFGELGENIAFDQAIDIKGPIDLGFALERTGETPDEPGQRAVVIADSDFLSNGFVAQLGNRRLGINILQWLASRDAQIDVHVPPAPDLQLVLSPAESTAIALLFILLLPGGLLGMGLLRWWARRAHRR